MTESPDTLLCPDWVFVNTCNVNIAKDRDWFKAYTPFSSTVTLPCSTPTPRPLKVVGIGTVEVPTKRSPNLSGVSSHGALQLKEVLHVPDIVCNILGDPVMSSDGYDIKTSFRPKSNESITDNKGRQVAYFDPKKRFFTLKVRDHPTGRSLGPSAFEEWKVYMLGCQWDAAEQKKWQEFKDKNGLAESIFGPTDDNNEGGLQGHPADVNFSPSQLKWIEEGWGSSENFMLSYGLKPYNIDDLYEAKAIADAMSAQDEKNYY